MCHFLKCTIQFSIYKRGLSFKHLSFNDTKPFLWLLTEVPNGDESLPGDAGLRCTIFSRGVWPQKPHRDRAWQHAWPCECCSESSAACGDSSRKNRTCSVCSQHTGNLYHYRILQLDLLIFHTFEKLTLRKVWD